MVSIPHMSVSADGRPADAVLLDGVLPEGPVKPRGHHRKPKPASLSLFEWALSLNQGSGSELVGARCQTASEGRGCRNECNRLLRSDPRLVVVQPEPNTSPSCSKPPRVMKFKSDRPCHSPMSDPDLDLVGRKGNRKSASERGFRDCTQSLPLPENSMMIWSEKRKERMRPARVSL